MGKKLSFLGVLMLLLAVLPAAGTDVEAAAPKSVTMSVYDTGFALCNELRAVVLAKGENTIRFGDVPPRMDPASASLALQTGEGVPVVLEQYLRGGRDSLSGLFAGWIGDEVEVQLAGETVEGRILSPPDEAGERPLLLQDAAGHVLALPWSEQLRAVRLKNRGAAQASFYVKCESKAEGPLNLRLLYSASGIRWDIFYHLLMDEGAGDVFFSARALLENDSGGRFEQARVRLVETQKGGVPRAVDSGGRDASPSSGASRYPYGSEEPAFERAAASAAAWRSFELSEPVSLQPGRTTHVSLLSAAKVGVSRFNVYDGVRLDRFERNPRNDWNYGTVSHGIVDSYLEINNTKENGLGLDLPRGALSVYVQRRDGSVDIAGQGRLASMSSGGVVRVQLGPASGLRGARERTGYTEISPLREYEETFEIRLENTSDEDVEIRVVEHLYRWNRYEIVKADTEYVKTGERTIEFKPVVKSGGQRSIHYTVRYRW